MRIMDRTRSVHRITQDAVKVNLCSVTIIGRGDMVPLVGRDALVLEGDRNVTGPGSIDRPPQVTAVIECDPVSPLVIL
jgi:hypothetical protein